MIYELKNCRNGDAAPYKTTVDISENNGRLRFYFVCEHTEYYCPYTEYNKIHSEGDACEVLIGTDPKRKVYYEMEVSAKGGLMLAEMVHHGFDENGNPIIDTNLIPNCFFDGKSEKIENGYTAEFIFDKKHIMTHGDRIYFNAYRLETDGGEMDKHLFALFPTMMPKFHVPSYFLWLDNYLK